VRGIQWRSTMSDTLDLEDLENLECELEAA
jgi:hypothetical protein